jgi:choloylglycine hydrolase
MRDHDSHSLTLPLAVATALLAGASLAGARGLAPCTTFCLEGPEGPVFGRNYDWPVSVGLVVVNKRGLVKTAMVDTQEAPATWTSRYGSITFNQYGRELPMGGLNEAGLVVEQMWLEGTRYPAADERPGLRELAWIQYQLDTARSLDEVVASDARVRILGTSVPIHFLLCDRSGEVAVVEFLDGEMVVRRGDSLLIPALANSRYAESMEYLERFQGFGGDQESPRTTGSLDRFARAACGVVDYELASAQETVDYAFGVLEQVRQSGTQWSIVYDVERLTVHFRTQAAPAVKSLALASFELSAETPCLILDIDTPEPGDARARFVEYSTQANRELVYAAWKQTSFLAETPDEVLDRTAEYPESIVRSTSKQE